VRHRVLPGAFGRLSVEDRQPLRHRLVLQADHGQPAPGVIARIVDARASTEHVLAGAAVEPALAGVRQRELNLPGEETMASWTGRSWWFQQVGDILHLLILACCCGRSAG
jgi:hypothetical protein